MTQTWRSSVLDGPDLDRIQANAAQIVDVFNREAQAAMKLKQLDLRPMTKPVAPRRYHKTTLGRIMHGDSLHLLKRLKKTPSIWL